MSQDLSAGTKLGRYEIRSKIGEGGMGEVYRALDTELDRIVAIKILREAEVRPLATHYLKRQGWHCNLHPVWSCFNWTAQFKKNLGH